MFFREIFITKAISQVKLTSVPDKTGAPSFFYPNGKGEVFPPFNQLILILPRMDLFS